MAGDWIKMRLDLLEDPAVIEMADALEVREEVIVGYCHAFWSWVSRQCHDGTVTGVTLTALGRRLNLPGFPELLVKVGWLEYDDSGERPSIDIPHFERHLSQSAKSRVLAANRQNVKRHGSVTKVSRNHRDKIVTDSSLLSNGAVVEENGEQKKDPYTEAFLEWWSAYPKLRRTDKSTTFKKWKIAVRSLGEVTDNGETPQDYLIRRAQEYAKSEQGRSEYVVGSARWLHGAKWEDPPEAWRQSGGNGNPPTPESQMTDAEKFEIINKRRAAEGKPLLK